MREVAEVHRDLFREHAARYGENVRVKMERCLTVTDEEQEEGLRAREAYREQCLQRLERVDLVLTLSEDTPLPLIEAIRPDLLVKGADYRHDQVVGAELVESRGGRVHLAPLCHGYSTSHLIAKMRAA